MHTHKQTHIFVYAIYAYRANEKFNNCIMCKYVVRKNIINVTIRIYKM